MTSISRFPSLASRWIFLFVLVLCASCATTRSEERRQPAGFEGLTSAFTGPSVLYKGPFTVSGGESRPAAKVYLPLQYDEKASWPLVVLLHGYSGTADIENLYLGLSVRASLRGFILLTPDGIKTPAGTRGEKGEDLGGIPFWNATDACCDFGKTNVDDLGYLRKLITEVQAKYHVDASKISLFGHSNGGFMANRLACEMGAQISSVAVLAGGGFKQISKCASAVPTPYLHVHAVNDPTIKYGDDPTYAGGQEVVRQWLNRNGCGIRPSHTGLEDLVALIPGKDTTTETWDSCASGKRVAFWTIKAAEAKSYKPHIPLFNLTFTDRVLDFLLAPAAK